MRPAWMKSEELLHKPYGRPSRELAIQWAESAKRHCVTVRPSSHRRIRSPDYVLGPSERQRDRDEHGMASDVTLVLAAVAHAAALGADRADCVPGLAGVVPLRRSATWPGRNASRRTLTGASGERPPGAAPLGPAARRRGWCRRRKRASVLGGGRKKAGRGAAVVVSPNDPVCNPRLGWH